MLPSTSWADLAMDHADEQAVELEMLQAMFMEDFVIERAEPPAAFHIDLFPESSGDEGANHVAAELHVTYTPSYPEEPPELRLVPKLGLSDALAREAQAMLLAATEELLGAAMIWSLAERTQAWLREHNAAPATNMHDEMMKRKAGGADAGGEALGAGAAGGTSGDGGDAEEDEDGTGAGVGGKRKAGGGLEVDERRVHSSYTPVTPENFAAWRAGFEARRGVVAAEASTKLTGRQLFEMGRQHGVDIQTEGCSEEDDGDHEDADYTRRARDEEDAEEEQAAAGGGGPIDESLFDDDDDDE